MQTAHYTPPNGPAFSRADRLYSAPPAWLWPNRIPDAQLTLLIGDPGVGKSLLATELAAKISAPLPWPQINPTPCATALEQCSCNPARSVLEQCSDNPNPPTNPLSPSHFVTLSPQLPCATALEQCSCKPARSVLEQCSDNPDHEPDPRHPWTPNYFLQNRNVPPTCPPHFGQVILASPEDHAEQIILPRLIAAGADLERVTILYGVTPPDDDKGPVSPLQLPDHIKALETAVWATPHARLLILDPLHALLSMAAQCSPAVLTNTLEQLARFSVKHNIAVIASVHIAKTRRGRILHNIRGALALSATARAAHLLTQDPDDPNRRILSPAKSIYGPPPPALAFKIADGPRIIWEDRPVQAHDESLSLAPDFQSALTEACNWLKFTLQQGPQPARKILKEAASIGLTRGTLFRAKHTLRIRSYKCGLKRWMWAFAPDDDPEPLPISASPPNDFEEFQMETHNT